MSDETAKVRAKLASLSASLDDLESILDPLFAQPLADTIVGLEPLQQAKLQTLIPYVAYDLIFVYLKTRGIDPKTHPVISELDRIRQYFEKVNKAENPPAERRTELDKAAAARFIKHAITEAKWKKTPAEEAQEDQSSSVPIPVKVTSKMIARAEYEKGLKENAEKGEDDEEPLQVYDQDGENEDDAMEVDQNQKGLKGKSKASDQTSPSEIPQGKRRRPVMDPFAGYGDEPTASAEALSKKSKPTDSSAPSPGPTSATASSKPKKAAKKSKKKKASS
ncbi:Sas10/Utp3/C1D family-domain-containing protein [Panaeolus papilionaceus]|nr:Sas10/Utp3/C1D family-domain-containing protein [Panaeolus papilionaceus]